jgi:predicted metalloprotease with PDZ domain
VLVFPKWIPAEHAPSGPLDSIIGLEIKAKGARLDWKRDPLDMFSVTVTVPAGADHVDISLDSGLSGEGSSFSSSPGSSEQLAIIRWNEFVLFPKGRDAATISATGSITPPTGWNTACSLDSHPAPQGAVEFETVPLSQLIDSPAQIGHYTRRVTLTGSAPSPTLEHSIAIAADSTAMLETPNDFAQGYSNLVAEAGALFASRHYRHYTWLLSLSDHVAHFGEEHHESSDNRGDENALSDPETRKGIAELLAHEYVHSWNGKYRRPQGLLSPDYQKPMDGTLLWVYEGMTQFWGDILPARAGLYSAADARELIAVTAGDFDIWPGVRWRPMIDTAVQAQRLYDASEAWTSARRSVDFYEASVYLWLDVDAEIRARTNGRASIDDFVKRFYAGPDGKPALKPYVEQELYDTLSAVAPGEWRSVLHRHLDAPNSDAMFKALERTGWKLTYSAEKNPWIELSQKRHKSTLRGWSIGLRLDEKGVILDTIEGRAAAVAGAGPGMTLVAVNGRKYSTEVLDAAIAEAQKTRQPIALLVENNEFYRTLSVPYFDGPRYPHLVRIDSTPDTLTEVLKSRTRKE